MNHEIEHVLPSCRQCGKFEVEDNEERTLHETAYDGPVCGECIDDQYIDVDGVGLLHHEETAYCAIDERPIPDDDAVQCSDCLETVHSIYITEVGLGDRSVCSVCIEQGDYACPDDDPTTYYSVDVLYWSDAQDCWLLEPDSSGALLEADANVFDYCTYTHYQRGTPSTVRIPNDALLFGVELETDQNGDGADIIVERLQESGCDSDYAICKEDGSVSGAEIVTLPADLESHRTAFAWDKWMAAIRPVAKGYYADQAGMHVHINRTAISPLTLGKMLVFTNAPANAPLLSDVAQRDIMHCHWCTTDPNKFGLVGKSGKEPTRGKYSILNVTLNTVEIRMFRSNLADGRVLKNIEFCHALVRFCQNTSARNLTAGAFVHYLTRNRKQYPLLTAFLGISSAEFPKKAAPVFSDRQAA